MSYRGAMLLKLYFNDFRTQKSALLDHVNLKTQKAARMTTSVDYSSTATVGPAHQAAQMTVLVKDAFLV